MITLKDKLSHLTYRQACKLLGAEGEHLLALGGKYDIDISERVFLSGDMFRLDLGETTVTICLDPKKNQRLDITCSGCSTTCEHQGAALSLILEEKLSLGLSALPPERIPIETLSDKQLIERALEDRMEKARTEKMNLKSMNKKELWADYIVTNNSSGKSYRIALRGWKRGESYCSCPDYRKNALGTCKHILYALGKVKKQFNKSVRETPFKVKNICVYVQYGEELELRLLIPEKIDSWIIKLLRPLKGKAVKDVKDLLKRIKILENRHYEVIIYPDAEEYINSALYLDRIRSKVEEIRLDPENHPLKKTLLKTELLSYQLDGIAFAAGAGRAVIADDMGLGKTIQGIGVAELLSQDINISRVLVVCPSSLKSQWSLEINRFTDRSCQLVAGSTLQRIAHYSTPCFFTICNYEQVVRDIMTIEKIKWDLIILDEGQRIKNWEAKTSQTIKALKSPFALVLSGTPLENRLEELYSVVEFIDDRRLGPAYRFLSRHRVANERGRVLGYKNLDELREKLKPVMLRRTRKKIMKDLPPRTTEIRRIPPTEEQLLLHNEQKKIIRRIISKKYFTEMDFLRLQKALLICRMAANSTFLVDKQSPGYSSKITEFETLIDQLLNEEDRKIVLFSEWTTMLNLIEPILKKRNLNYVRLDGSVPQKKRQGLIHQFQLNADCKLFITTNAGSTGLNLQAANTVINLDLPWNPAVLEQRVSRAHRMGQERPVHVFLLVTEDTLEESLLETLSAKHELALAVLDPETDMTTVTLASGIDEMKRRLEILLGTKPEAPKDMSLMEQVERGADELARRERIATAGGQLFGAAFSFIGELFSGKDESEETIHLAEILKKQLYHCLEKGEEGGLKLTINIPDETTLDTMARSLAHIAGIGRKNSADTISASPPTHL